MGTESNVSSKIVESGTAEITVVLAPPAPIATPEQPRDRVIELGTATLAPGLATRLL
jgi:hypothetical protein